VQDNEGYSRTFVRVFDKVKKQWFRAICAREV